MLCLEIVDAGEKNTLLECFGTLSENDSNDLNSFFICFVGAVFETKCLMYSSNRPSVLTLVLPLVLGAYCFIRLSYAINPG